MLAYNNSEDVQIVWYADFDLVDSPGDMKSKSDYVFRMACG